MLYPVGSRFRGNDAAPWVMGGRGALRPVRRLRADWIPAYAGMTNRLCKGLLWERARVRAAPRSAALNDRRHG